MIDLSADLARLTAGAAAWAVRSPAARGQLALEAARSTAALADAWVAAAVAIKQAAGSAVSGAIRAEETATGPLLTLRLLLVTAGALGQIDRTGLPGLSRPPRLGRHTGDAARIEVEALPAAAPRGSLYDGAIFQGHRATVRCVDPGGLEAFQRSCRCSPRRSRRSCRRGCSRSASGAPSSCRRRSPRPR